MKTFDVFFITTLIIIYYIIIKNFFDNSNILPHSLLWKTTNSANDVFFTKKEGFLDESTAHQLANLLTWHPKNIKNGGLGDGFKGIRGFTVRFKNLKNAKYLFQEKLKLPEVWKIFKKIRTPGTNAWIINTLVVEPSNHNIENPNRVDLHYDDTIGISSPVGGFIPFWKRDLAAHWINMVYVQIPPDMIKGEILGWPQGFSRTHELLRFVGCHKLINVPPPTLNLQPKTGMHLKVRGDVYHGVEPFYLEKTSSPRISLIIEEYKCNPQELAEIGEKAAMTTEKAY